MDNESKNKPASEETGRAAIANIKRMLAGEVPFPKDQDEARAIVEARSPLKSVPKEEIYSGTMADFLASVEDAVELTKAGVEFWSCRRLMSLLGYGSDSWKNFENVILKAQYACERSNQRISDHFSETGEMVSIGSGATRSRKDVQVTRYGAYLIAMNGEPRKRQVAYAQTYFAAQARRQELADQSAEPRAEDRKRIELRDQLKKHNRELAGVAKAAGVVDHVDFAVFQNHGYKGLYAGLDVSGIRGAKGLADNAQILDHMGSTELAANFFRVTQAEDKLRRENIRGKVEANAAHSEVGQKVRKAIGDIGGVMPEDLPAHEDLNKVRQRLVKENLTVKLKIGKK